MDNNDIKSQLEKTKLPAFGTENAMVSEVVAGTGMAQTMESESMIRKNIPLAPTETSLRQADAAIRKEVKKGLEKEMIPMIASQEAERSVRQDTGESGRREVERMETATAAATELSTRQAQEQVPKRVGPNVVRPRLAQKRPPASPAQAIAKKGISKALKWGLIAGGSTAVATGGILGGITSLFT